MPPYAAIAISVLVVAFLAIRYTPVGFKLQAAWKAMWRPDPRLGVMSKRDAYRVWRTQRPAPDMPTRVEVMTHPDEVYEVSAGCVRGRMGEHEYAERG